MIYILRYSKYYVTLRPKTINQTKFIKMKRLNILLLVALVLILSIISCTKEDKDTDKELKVPIGRFIYDKWTETENGVTSEERLAYKPECPERRYFEFMADGEMEEKYVGTVDEPCANVFYQGTYTQTGNVVTIVQDNYTQIFTLLDVTATILKISRSYKDDPTHTVTFTLIKE